jgi:hypothetical protein
MPTYQQISKKHNIPINALKKRVMKLGIKGIYGGQTKVFTFSQELEIVSYKPLSKRNKDHDPRKIGIVETFLELKSVRQTAMQLKLHRDTVSKVVQEYTLDKHITVESKINKGHE